MRGEKNATLNLGPTIRLPYIEASLRHLNDKGFPNICWLRMPDPDELDAHLNITVATPQHLMTLWRTNVPQAVQQICTACNCTGAMIVEDTVLLRKDDTYEDVAAEITESEACAGV